MIGVIFIITGLICLLLGRTNWHKNYIEKHNFESSKEFAQDIRIMLG